MPYHCRLCHRYMDGILTVGDVIAHEASCMSKLRPEDRPVVHGYPPKYGVQGNNPQVETLRLRVSELEGVLRECQRLFKDTLPKFNWGASALDADAIRTLNEVPGRCNAVLRD